MSLLQMSQDSPRSMLRDLGFGKLRAVPPAEPKPPAVEPTWTFRDGAVKPSPHDGSIPIDLDAQSGRDVSADLVPAQIPPAPPSRSPDGNRGFPESLRRSVPTETAVPVPSMPDVDSRIDRSRHHRDLHLSSVTKIFDENESLLSLNDSLSADLSSANVRADSITLQLEDALDEIARLRQAAVDRDGEVRKRDAIIAHRDESIATLHKRLDDSANQLDRSLGLIDSFRKDSNDFLSEAFGDRVQGPSS